MSEDSAVPCFVLSAPSGTGKTTLAHAVLQHIDKVTRTVSWTTRAPRAGESHGIDYTFVTEQAFEAHLAAGGFLESALVHGHRYGTPVDEIDRIVGLGNAPLMVIDVQGAESVRRRLARAVTIFVVPPSRPVLEQRLAGREGADAASDETLRRRLGVATEEIAQYVRYDYVIINDDFDRAVRELGAILVAERCRRPARETPAAQILQSFRS